MNLSLISNNFIGNTATKGGALYFLCTYEIRNVNTIINMEDNIFEKNYAKSYGGAIYSEYENLYLTSSKNNTIINNYAELNGGGIYTPNNRYKTMFNMNNWLIKNNTINFNILNNYSTRPSYILLKKENLVENENVFNVVTGDNLLMVFELYDEFHNKVDDSTKIFSALSMKLSLISEKDYNENTFIESDINKYFVIQGNRVPFTNGN